jgi:S1-C subfamily serine protease
MKVGDIVIGIEGKLIETIEQFNKEVKNYKAGDTVKVSVYRDGEIIDLNVVLDEEPLGWLSAARKIVFSKVNHGNRRLDGEI